MEGAALFNSTTINAVGIANVADSLAAVRQAIYEEKAITWQELKNALKDNFHLADHPDGFGQTQGKYHQDSEISWYIKASVAGKNEKGIYGPALRSRKQRTRQYVQRKNSALPEII